MSRTRISVAAKLLYEYFSFQTFAPVTTKITPNNLNWWILKRGWLKGRQLHWRRKPWFKISILSFASISKPNKPIANCLRAISRPWHSVYYESVISLFLAGVTLINIHKPFPIDPQASVHLIASWSDLLNAIKANRCARAGTERFYQASIRKKDISS